MKIEVRQKAFVDQDIYLDGHSWKNCTFTRCNIIIERGEFDLINNRFDACRLTARGNAIAILKVAKLFYPQIPLIETQGNQS